MGEGATAPSTAAEPLDEAASRAARNYPTQAIWALVLACIGFFIPFVGIAGLVLGLVALKRIDREGRRGSGIALAAVVLGTIDLVLFFIAVLVITGFLLGA